MRDIPISLLPTSTEPVDTHLLVPFYPIVVDPLERAFSFGPWLLPVFACAMQGAKKLLSVLFPPHDVMIRSSSGASYLILRSFAFQRRLGINGCLLTHLLHVAGMVLEPTHPAREIS